MRCGAGWPSVSRRGPREAWQPKKPPVEAGAQGSQAFRLIKADSTTAGPDEVSVEGHHWPLIPEGQYAAQYIGHETAVSFTVPKAYVHFRLVEPGEHLGVHLYRAFRVKELTGRPRKGGGFKLGKRHELTLCLCRLYEKEWTRISSKRLRPDRLSLKPLANMVVRVSVRTVIKDHKQRPLPECMQYSVVDEILYIEAGSLGPA